MGKAPNRWFKTTTKVGSLVAGMLAVVAVACGTQTETIEVVKEVVTQVEVPVETIKEVIKEVPVEIIVEREVEKVVTQVIEKPVEVIREVPVERVVTEIVEVPVEKIVERVVEKIVPKVTNREIVKEKIVVATPTAVGQVARVGGTIRVAITGPLGTLDVLKTTSQPEIGARHSQETLFDFDENLSPKRTLVDSWKVSDDGLTYTFKLRDGITFNGPVEGRPLTSEIAMASWRRWLDRDSFGAILDGFISSIETPDDAHFVVTLSEPTGLLLDGFARIGGYTPFIMPPEMNNVAPNDGPGQGDWDTFGGTGPYKLTEWRPGERIVFSKWDGYKPITTNTSFLSGKKHAYADIIEGIVVPEAASRIAALETGQLDWIGQVSSDDMARLEANPRVRVVIEGTGNTRIGAWPNHTKGPFSDARVRRALMMAMRNEDALLAYSGNPALHRQCASLMLCGTRWGGLRTPGDEIYYDPPDIEGAKALIEEAGYAGATVILMTRSGAAPYAQVTREVLEDIGMKVDFQQVDRATYSAGRANPDAFDLFFTGGPVSWGGISPLLNSTLAKDKYWNKYKDPSGKFTEYLAEFARATSDRQDELIVDMQKLFFVDLQYIPYGEVMPIFAGSSRLHGVEIRIISSHSSYVNAWKE